MERDILTHENLTFELCMECGEFIGIGAVRIGGRQVRSGRLPLSPYTQTFLGHSLRCLRLLGIDNNGIEIRLRMQALFEPLPVKLMKDHMFDPIHDTRDWDSGHITGEGELELVLKPAREEFDGYEFTGFSYHYEYKSKDTEIFYLYDRASWELDGNIENATAISQCSCSAPIATFQNDTEWSTEGRIFFADKWSGANPVMTHNLPRWASHQCFDFQYKNGLTMVGVFERVDLIRSLMLKEKGKPELKVFDKHIFNQQLSYATSPKKILLNETAKTETAQKNIWTWLMQELHGRARSEYGLAEEPLVPRIHNTYWRNFTADTYYKDMLPALVNTGIRSCFIDNMLKSDHSEGTFMRGMCSPHEWEPAPSLGGTAKLKELVDNFAKKGIHIYSWVNNSQSLCSPVLNPDERDARGWYVRLEDTRQKYGSAYTNVISVIDMANDEARRHWIESLINIKAETGMNGYLFDSFYNMAFTPVSYKNGRPSVMWRETISALKELQDAGIHFMVESLGPFGKVQHGCAVEYNLENLFACYKIRMGTGYTTVPTGSETAKTDLWPEKEFYRIHAHLADPGYNLYYNGIRIDNLMTSRHKQTIQDYYSCYPLMRARRLQEDGGSVVWDGPSGASIIWNFVPRRISADGLVRNVTEGRNLPKEKMYALEPETTYIITPEDK